MSRLWNNLVIPSILSVLESEAFYALIDNVVTRIREENGQSEATWIDDKEAMQLLRIRSRDIIWLQLLRTEKDIHLFGFDD